MSKPVTNTDIEDVLSSIRRLVSEDVRPRKPQREAPPERLVLTPALRVKDAPAAPSRPTTAPVLLTNPSEREQASVPENTGSAPDDVLSEDDAPSLDGAPDRRDDALGRLVHDEVVRALSIAQEADPQDVTGARGDDDQGAAPSAVEPDPHDIATWSEARVAEPRAALDPSRQTAATELDDAFVWAGKDTPMPTPASRDPQSLESKISAIEAILRRQTGETPPSTAGEDISDGAPNALPGPEGSPTQPDVVATAEHVGHADVEADAPAGIDALVSEWTDADDAPLQSDDDEPERPTESDLGAVQTPGANTVTDVAANSSESDREGPATFMRAATSGAALDWEDHDASTPQPGRAAALLEAPDPVAPSPVAIDEEMLRGMVSNLIREELQGVLGERITRNVRKLVRREIHRVLMTQDYD